MSYGEYFDTLCVFWLVLKLFFFTRVELTNIITL